MHIVITPEIRCILSQKDDIFTWKVERVKRNVSTRGYIRGVVDQKISLLAQLCKEGGNPGRTNTMMIRNILWLSYFCVVTVVLYTFTDDLIKQWYMQNLKEI